MHEHCERSFLPHLSRGVTEIKDIRHLFNSDCTYVASCQNCIFNLT